MPHPHTSESVDFSKLGLAPTIVAALERLQFTVPTPIQAQAIPVAVEGKDIIGVAQTGTGKTLAYALPMLQRVARTKQRGLVLLPTRELALQVDEVLQTVGRSFGFRTALIIGGMSMSRQVEAIRRKPHVVLGTPGRILDHLQQGTLHLKDVGILVLDEADRMLDMGFAPQLTKILNHVPRERQTMLFSATIPPAIVQIAARHMKMPVRVEVAPSGTVAARLHQDLFIVRNDEKSRLLGKLLSEYRGTVLVFCRTKHGAKRLCRSLRAQGHAVAEIHSNLSLSQRRRALDGFKSGAYRVLVATDIAARGIDVQNIEVVINYDFPENPHDYVHRVGRTGRAGQPGHAVTFITPDQRGKIRGIERLVRTPLRISPLPELPPPPASNAAPARSDPRSGSGERSDAGWPVGVQHESRRVEPARPSHGHQHRPHRRQQFQRGSYRGARGRTTDDRRGDRGPRR